MATIKQEDFIQSVADALQYISYYHPVDYITSLARAYEREESPAAKDAMAQILINSRMCAEGHRPICQDTGIVTVFLKIGMDVRWDATDDRAGDGGCGGAAGVSRIRITRCGRRFWPIPACARKNTKDNTPAVVSVEMVRAARLT